MSESLQHENEAPEGGAPDTTQPAAETETPLALETAELGAALGLDDETLRLFLSTGC